MVLVARTDHPPHGELYAFLKQLGTQTLSSHTSFLRTSVDFIP
jgi:hypothetical protein